MDDFDVQRISVSVNIERSNNDDQHLYKSIVRLTRLSDDEILKWNKVSPKKMLEKVVDKSTLIKKNADNDDNKRSESPVKKTKIATSTKQAPGMISNTKEKNKSRTDADGYATRSKKRAKTVTSEKSTEKSTDTKAKRKSCTNADGYASRSKRSKMVTSDEKALKSPPNAIPSTSTAATDAITSVVTVDNKQSDVNTIALMPFVIGEVVWGKIRGWPHWPARIVKIHSPPYTKTPIRYEVYWFNDYRTTKLFRSQVYNYNQNYEIYTKKCETTIGLKTATREALMYIASKLE